MWHLLGKWLRAYRRWIRILNLVLRKARLEMEIHRAETAGIRNMRIVLLKLELKHVDTMLHLLNPMPEVQS